MNEMWPRLQGALPPGRQTHRVVGSGLRSMLATKALSVNLVPKTSYPFSPPGFETVERAREVLKASGTDLSP